MSDEYLPIVLDLRTLQDDEEPTLASLVADALFDQRPNEREEAIAEITDVCPNIIGAYQSGKNMLILLQEAHHIFCGLLGPVPRKYQKKESHPFLEPND